MVRFAFALVYAVQPAPNHTISEYVHLTDLTCLRGFTRFRRAAADVGTLGPWSLAGVRQHGCKLASQQLDEAGGLRKDVCMVRKTASLRKLCLIPVRLLLVSVLGCAALFALTPGLAAAQSSGGGNSPAAHACQDGGFVNLVRSDGSTFANVGDCVSYAARGGTLVPVTLNVSFSPCCDGLNTIVTAIGSGLEPGSIVTYTFINDSGTQFGPAPVPVNPTVAPDGNFSSEWVTGCPGDHSFVFYATTAYGRPITATGC